jgi:NDP-sugar pyrophosphorylase family protein
MKTLFESVRDFFVTQGDELTEADFKDALHFLEVNDKITNPTNEQMIAEIERLIEIEMERLDDEACE